MATYDPANISGLQARGLSQSQAEAFIRKYGNEDAGRPDHFGLQAKNWDQTISEFKASSSSEEIREQGMEALERQMELSSDFGVAMMREAEAGAERAIQRNLARWDEITGMSLSTATGAAAEINAAMRGEYENALDSLYPAWREDIIGAAATAQGDSIALTKRFREKVLPGLLDSTDEMSAQALSVVSSQLAGELPDDVADQLKRHAAEVSQQIGVRGQAAQFLTARDLGRTSLDLMNMGLQNAPAALNLAPAAYGTYAQTLQNPVTTGSQVTNLLAPFRAPVTDIGGLYSGQLNLLSGAGTVNPTQALATGAQVQSSAGGLIQNQMQFNAQQTSQDYWNNLNYDAQVAAARKPGFDWGGFAANLYTQGAGAAAEAGTMMLMGG